MRVFSIQFCFLFLKALNYILSSEYDDCFDGFRALKKYTDFFLLLLKVEREILSAKVWYGEGNVDYKILVNYP
jgi:hypothetical protein